MHQANKQETGSSAISRMDQLNKYKGLDKDIRCEGVSGLTGGVLLVRPVALRLDWHWVSGQTGGVLSVWLAYVGQSNRRFVLIDLSARPFPHVQHAANKTLFNK
ncbi:hypothetical protein E2562_005955 [Oryza meyeriana var. granulata]|uniref:Uncharacterized protein n=1 Tax=Oryza meyeriana var. granulata TaxID=110450 RepID=A0A6G1DV54_9ORYZ|nr:hypothetical protein E2562_005955 [Oryza meyeriana var. granulata]